MFELNLPAPSARSLLLTVIGEMMYAPSEAAWTTALLHVLGGLGVEEHAARQVLARAADAGWVVRERDGRAVKWRLAEKGRALVTDGIHRSDAYLAGPPEWDGRWLLLFVTVPGEQRTTRKRLYGGLSWLGLGNPMPGVWLTPHTERGAELSELVESLGLRSSALSVVGTVHDAGLGGDEIAGKAWDLTDLEVHYKTLLDQLNSLPEPRGGDETLFAYLELLNVQQRFMRRDPYLPEELLPEWIGRDGAALIRACRERWGRLAHARWRELVRDCAPR
ncbi:PaaX family transcriptional regulator C-terminal domain-containing protein [Nocardia jiangxiensis]|uniref:PaaX family transcriptional regulator C-terminal domain-containing protein n=1 Tax=Nocardia jiangxiensis TaxID=282685 RepID=A0ABW6S8P6_9NOCA